MAGILYVVATPIGNLEDLTFRAKRILGEVGLIAAEDTRRTAKLLAHYAIRKPVISVREHNEAREAGRVIARLEEGVDVALVSDAGTPGIADPGARLVRAVLNHELRVMPIPGPSAITAALSVSGMDASQFVFMGFPPRKGTDRETWFIDLAAESRTVVFFEAPHRIERTLAQVESIKRPIVVIKEISKINELLVKSHCRGPSKFSGIQHCASGNGTVRPSHSRPWDSAGARNGACGLSARDPSKSSESYY